MAFVNWQFGSATAHKMQRSSPSSRLFVQINDGCKVKVYTRKYWNQMHGSSITVTLPAELECGDDDDAIEEFDSQNNKSGKISKVVEDDIASFGDDDDGHDANAGFIALESKMQDDDNQTIASAARYPNHVRVRDNRKLLRQGARYVLPLSFVSNEWKEKKRANPTARSSKHIMVKRVPRLKWIQKPLLSSPHKAAAPMVDADSSAVQCSTAQNDNNNNNDDNDEDDEKVTGIAVIEEEEQVIDMAAAAGDNNDDFGGEWVEVADQHAEEKSKNHEKEEEEDSGALSIEHIPNKEKPSSSSVPTSSLSSSSYLCRNPDNMFHEFKHEYEERQRKHRERTRELNERKQRQLTYKSDNDRYHNAAAAVKSNDYRYDYRYGENRRRRTRKDRYSPYESHHPSYHECDDYEARRLEADAKRKDWYRNENSSSYRRGREQAVRNYYNHGSHYAKRNQERSKQQLQHKEQTSSLPSSSSQSHSSQSHSSSSQQQQQEEQRHSLR